MPNDTSIEVTPTAANGTAPECCFQPPIDVTEDADAFTVYADMPGVAPTDIAIGFEQQTLNIRGSVPARPAGDVNYLMHEYGVADFRRELSLAHGIDVDNITADYEHGVLTVRLPKSADAKPRRIPVRTA